MLGLYWRFDQSFFLLISINYYSIYIFNRFVMNLYCRNYYKLKLSTFSSSFCLHWRETNASLLDYSSHSIYSITKNILYKLRADKIIAHNKVKSLLCESWPSLRLRWEDGSELSHVDTVRSDWVWKESKRFLLLQDNIQHMFVEVKNILILFTLNISRLHRTEEMN